MNHFSTLPIDCLVLIFEQFSLRAQLTRLRLVCTDWCNVIEQRICQRKGSLKLFGSERNITDYCLTLICDNANATVEQNHSRRINDDQIVLDTLRYSDDLEMYPFLSRLFSDNITQLTVHFYRDTCFDHLELFVQNCLKLTELTLCGSMIHQNVKVLAKLCHALDTLPELTVLHLLTTDLFLSDDREYSVPIAIPGLLNRLQRFSLLNYKGNLSQVIGQLNGDRLKCLRLDLPRDQQSSSFHLVRLIKEKQSIISGLTHLRLSMPDLAQLTNTLISTICHHLGSLQHLDLQCCSFVNFELVKLDANFIEHINQLSNLTELRLSHVGIDLNILNGGRTPTISSVKTLHLSQVVPLQAISSAIGSLYTQTCTDEEVWEAMAVIFNNVEHLFIRTRNDSIPLLRQHLKQYFGTNTTYRVYCPDERLHEFFGKLQRVLPSKDDSYRGEGFFSESFFDRLCKS